MRCLKIAGSVSRRRCVALCAVLLAGVAGPAAGCGQAREAVQTAGADAGSVAVLGRAAIERAAGVRLAGDLDCVRPQTVPASGEMPVNCTGTTEGGRVVTLTGTAAQVTKITDRVAGAHSARGHFAATVGGDHVLTATCLGRC